MTLRTEAPAGAISPAEQWETEIGPYPIDAIAAEAADVEGGEPMTGLTDAEPSPNGDEHDVLPIAKSAGRPAKKKEKKKSQSSTLVTLAKKCGCITWHSQDGEPYATVPVDKHHEHWPIRSRGFKRWLCQAYFRQTAGSAPGSQSLQDALNVLEGQAVYSGKVHDVAVRVAQHDDAIYLDLADADWQAVKVTAKGWRVVKNSPVRFRRAKAMLLLPEPETGGDVATLRQFLNISDTDWPLVVAWLLAAYRPTGPYPALCLHGEQGSGKSTQARVLRRLVDPNSADLRCEPKEARDLMIAANNGWVTALDNISYLPPWLSDALCRLSTGGGFATRTLYENDEETIFDSMRPLLITGIEELATRSDLLDRSILVTLPTIPEHKRRPESELWAAFNEARPMILGALLAAVSEAMRELPGVRLSRLPRMADFALWATAGESSLGLATGAFMASYSANRAGANDSALESSPVAKFIAEIVASGEWTGSAAELLATLDEQADEKTKRARGWPQTPRALSGALKRVAPNLRAAGLDVAFSREPDRQRRRIITLTKLDGVGIGPSEPSEPSEPWDFEGKSADGTKTRLRPKVDGFASKAGGADANADRADGTKTRLRPKESPENRAFLAGSDGADGSDANFPALSKDGEEEVVWTD